MDQQSLYRGYRRSSARRWESEVYRIVGGILNNYGMERAMRRNEPTPELRLSNGDMKPLLNLISQVREEAVREVCEDIEDWAIAHPNIGEEAFKAIKIKLLFLLHPTQSNGGKEIEE